VPDLPVVGDLRQQVREDEGDDRQAGDDADDLPAVSGQPRTPSSSQTTSAERVS
jgi:hypothetical protein